MRIRELIKLMPTQFRRVSSASGLYVGHHIPLLGTWSKAQGYIKKQSLKDDNIAESLACPIIAVVSNKFGNKDATLTITGKTSTFKYVKETNRGDYTVSKNIYEPTETTITSTLTIPRYTRPYATFLITGLGRMIYEITSITDNADFDVGEIEFYALASSGSKIIYWMGIHSLAEELRTILRPWIAPTTCNRCQGTGIEPSSGTNSVCEQCLGYKYDGYSGEAIVQRKIGFDVGLARKILDWDNLTDADHILVKKFINQAWTQRWWVTPTVGEIKRLIRHFYMIEDSDIEITERFHPQEPVWSIFLPIDPDTNAPFGQQTLDDRSLIKYIAESVTPAGVSVFMGFYEIIPGTMGDLDFNCVCPMFEPRPRTSWEAENSLWGSPRWDFHNGWQNAVIDFEPVSPGMPPKNGSFKSPPDPPKTVEDSFNSYGNINDALANGWTREVIAGAVYSIDNGGSPRGKVLKVNDNTNTGYYPATYSFTDDADGANPTGWLVTEQGGCTVDVISDLGGHEKVVELERVIGVNKYAYMTNNFAIQVSGSIEWWIRATDVTRQCYSNIGGVATAYTVWIDVNEIRATDGAGFISFVTIPVDNTWYYISTTFDCSTDTYSVVLRSAAGVVLETYNDLNFVNLSVGLDKMSWNTQWAVSAAYSFYLDAIGYSWDEEYIVSDNLVEVGAQIYKDITAEDDRMIQFYIKGDLDEYLRIYFKNSDDIAFSIKVESSDLYWIDDDSWVQGSVVSNDWHLISIDLDCDNDQYDLYFDENLEASAIDFQQSLGDINRIHFETESGSLDYDVYCDCIMVDTKFPGDTSTSPLIDKSGYLYSNPHAESWEVNDRFRHECRLRNSGAFFDVLYENYQLTGAFEWWWHPSTSDLRNSFYDRNNLELFYVEYDVVAKGVDCGGGLVDMMSPDCDQHVRINFDCSQSFCGLYITGDYNVYINRDLKYSGSFTGSEGIYHNKFHNTSQGTGFIDALGWNYGSGATGGYTIGNNYGTLDWWGYGSQHENCIGSECNLLEKYFFNDRVIII